MGRKTQRGQSHCNRKIMHLEERSFLILESLSIVQIMMSLPFKMPIKIIITMILENYEITLNVSAKYA